MAKRVGKGFSMEYETIGLGSDTTSPCSGALEEGPASDSGLSGPLLDMGLSGESFLGLLLLIYFTSTLLYFIYVKQFISGNY